MAVGVVGLVVLPASPDDLGPGAGEDAFSVGVAFAVGAELPVAVGCPFVGSSRVAGEAAHDVAEPCVGGPSEGDGSVPARGSGGWCYAGEACKRGCVGEPSATVADLGEHGRRSDRAATGQQRPEDVGVGVRIEQVLDPCLEVADLVNQGFDDFEVGQGDGGAGGCFDAVGALGSSLDVCEQLRR